MRRVSTFLWRCVSLSEVKVLKQPQSPAIGGIPPFGSSNPREKAQVLDRTVPVQLQYHTGTSLFRTVRVPTGGT